jgi:hypothetical protein
MPDRPLFNLAPRWRLAHDRLQWVVQRKHGSKWRSRHFIATKKAVLERIFREEGICLTPEARRAVDALPDSFREWQRQRLPQDGLATRQREAD